MPRMKKIRGFAANAKAIARRQGLPMKNARAILASGARKASASAIKKNPRLKKVSGVVKKRMAKKR